MIILQKIPVIGIIIRKWRNITFPKNIRHGDIVRGFPKFKGICDAVYCSHVLEHLSYDEFVIAIQNTYSLLKSGGVFRLLMPDLNRMCQNYLKSSDPNRAITFMSNSFLGLKSQRKFIDRIIGVFSNSRHNWLWDYESVELILKKAGFTEIRACAYHDSILQAFEEVEDIKRFEDLGGSLAVEAVHP